MYLGSRKNKKNNIIPCNKAISYILVYRYLVYSTPTHTAIQLIQGTTLQLRLK